MSRPLPVPTPNELRLSRIADRRYLNCVDCPRTVYNVTRLCNPSSLDDDYLLEWILEHPATLPDDASALLTARKPLYVVDIITKRPTNFLEYDLIAPHDIVVYWDWVRNWVRKPGQRGKTSVPGFKKIIQVEGRTLLSGRRIASPLDTSNLRPLFVA